MPPEGGKPYKSKSVYGKIFKRGGSGGGRTARMLDYVGTDAPPHPSTQRPQPTSPKRKRKPRTSD